MTHGSVRRAVFPHCTRPVESCDLDHLQAHADGGETCPRKPAPVVPRPPPNEDRRPRAHYRMLSPGTHQWTLPSGTYLVDPTGTHAPILRTSSSQPHTRHRRDYRHCQGWFRGSSLALLAPQPPSPRLVASGHRR